MSELQFRNLNVTPSDPVEQWGVEGIATAIDRGGSQHWARIEHAIGADPYGEVALDLEEALQIAQSPGITKLLAEYLKRARETKQERYARIFRRLVRESGMSRADLAKHLGTSRSRLSTYETGKVTPSAIVAHKVWELGEKRRRQLLQP